MTSESVSFGFKDVQAGDKAGLVKGVFDRVASRYDLMNDLMSGGVHRLWKGMALDWLDPQPGQVLLDVAGGTGDMALGFLERAARKARRRGEGVPARAIICDINEMMLRAGLGQRGARPDLARVAGDAERLPLADRSVDVCTIAFGIRNVTRIEAALAEMRRVLRPGGRLMVLEFSTVNVPGLDALYEAYSFKVIPRLGQLVAGDGEAYRYLVESIRRFPDQARFAGMMRGAGFREVAWRDLSGGIAALHSGWNF